MKARQIGGQIYREPLAITGTDPGSPDRAAATEAYRCTRWSKTSPHTITALVRLAVTLICARRLPTE